MITDQLQILNLNQSPFSCKWFAFGLAFQDFLELFSLEFCHLLGVVVEAGLVQLFEKFFLSHGLPLLKNIY
jgi:hypothetical protein